MILQDADSRGQIHAELAGLLADPAAERLRIAVAYANLGGVEALRELLTVAPEALAVEIVVSLDLGITREAALEAMLESYGASAKAIASVPGAGTFHAKAFVVDRREAPPRALVGSANLTSAALTKNREAVSVGELQPADAAAWEAWWSALLGDAQPLTPELIAGYQERRPPPGSRERIGDEELETAADGSPVEPPEPPVSSASWLVVDWGGTGEHRVQFEFPKEAAAFFGADVVKQKGEPVTLLFEGQEYTNNQLTYYPDNGMARMNMDPVIPVVTDDSIVEGTSLFSRLGPDRYELRLLDRAERAARLSEARLLGGIGHTVRTRDGSQRRFGWA